MLLQSHRHRFIIMILICSLVDSSFSFYSHIFAPGLGLFYKVRCFDPKGQCCEGSFVLHPSQRLAVGDLKGAGKEGRRVVENGASCSMLGG